MILKASQRAGGTQLAMHLLKTEENEHVEVHEVSGFASDRIHEAFKEAYAISRGTKCRQFLFSLSLSPPEKESVPIATFEKAIADIESKIGLAGQPRVIVFHEKEGRRHAHCVWSRIDAGKMRAINLPHFKLKLRDISRQLYLENNWQMPRGLVNSEERNPLNFSQAEWQQAKRIKQDPRLIKQAFQDCWAISDSRAAFASALEERGYTLAKGNRRGHVAIDWRGEIYAVSRWVGVKAKNVRARLGDPDELPSVNETKTRIAQNFSEKLQRFADEARAAHDKAQQAFGKKREAMTARHRQERSKLKAAQAKRRIHETKDRVAQMPTGLKALWFRLSGKYKKVKEQNEREARRSKLRDRAERQKLIDRQLRQRRALQHEIRMLRHHHGIRMKRLDRDMAEYLRLSHEGQEKALRQKEKQTRPERRRRRKNRDFG